MNKHLRFLENPPLRADWLRGHPAFESRDGDLVRAYLKLCAQAFREGGAVESSVLAISNITGLSESRVVARWDLLMEGWVLNEDGRLAHAGIVAGVAEFEERHASRLQGIRDSLAVVEADFGDSAKEVPAPVQLGMLQGGEGAPIGGGPKPKGKPGRRAVGKHMLPAEFGLTPDLERWMVEERGITHPFHHKFLMEGFIAYAQAKNPLFSDWNAAFRSNVDMALSSGRRLPMPPEQLAMGDGVVDAAPRRPMFGVSPEARQEGIRSSAESAFMRAQRRNEGRGGLHG